MSIEEIVETIREELDEKDLLREEALRITREIVRLSGDTVKAIHRGDIPTARARFEEVEKKVEELKEKLKDHPDLYYTGYVQTAHQEFVEAALLLSYVMGKPYPTPWELDVPKADYALGLGDFIGELRRYFLLRLLEGDIEAAERAYREMENVYNALMTLEYPKGLVNIRTKQDQARHILERTLEDLTRAKLNKKLEEKLKAAVGDE
ncbi:translin family protein [Thermococcus peptonophilus]|uniref:Haloacid dehalogenase n=1 Tax=Thermococcus peptonophilus TaxID=53952 RepID=A0A142CSL4_9EURY|nr:haloacid dehalogenase [Thermococcus peptonophilus]AMQ17766.1 haloacid dehalogenase [Thermococcus peptonophilus]